MTKKIAIIVSFFRKNIDDFIRKAVYDFSKLFLYLIVLLLMAVPWSIFLYIDSDITCNLVAILFVVITLVSLFFYLFFNKMNRVLPRFDFNIVKKELIYRYINKTDVVYEKKIRLKALRNNLDCYIDKYHWTGERVADVKSAKYGQTVREARKKNIWSIYEISFMPALKKSEEIDTHVIWNLKGIKAVPFFSSTVEEPTNLLKLHLYFPVELRVPHVIWEISVSIGALRPIDTGILKVNEETGEVEWTIKNPKLLHHYEIKWDTSSLQQNLQTTI